LAANVPIGGTIKGTVDLNEDESEENKKKKLE
jgi:hypothetical protein